MKTRYKVDRVSTLQKTLSHGYSISTRTGEKNIIIIYKDQDFYCYLNRCPHTGVNLDWSPNQFLDSSGRYVQCSTHGALFEIANGFCVSGPCSGDRLQQLPQEIEEDVLYVFL